MIENFFDIALTFLWLVLMFFHILFRSFFFFFPFCLAFKIVFLKDISLAGIYDVEIVPLGLSVPSRYIYGSKWF